MLEHTFVHLPCIGLRTELKLWRQGILTWDDLERHLRDWPRSPERRQLLRRRLQASREHQQEPAYFQKLLPASERWRLYGDFRGCCGFLDIETTGLDGSSQEITVIGIHDGRETYQFVNGENLEEFEDAIQAYRVLVTFNGSRFDLPFIVSFFPNFRFHHAHIDLCHLTRRLGLRGGLKCIEAFFGIRRDPAIQNLSGREAVVLWQRHLHGDPQALGRLLRYNRADVVNLKTIMELLWKRLHRQLELAAGYQLPG